MCANPFLRLEFSVMQGLIWFNGSNVICTCTSIQRFKGLMGVGAKESRPRSCQDQ